MLVRKMGRIVAGGGLVAAVAWMVMATAGCHSDDGSAAGTLPPGVTNAADLAKGVPSPVPAAVQSKIDAYQQAEARDRAKHMPHSASLPTHP